MADDRPWYREPESFVALAALVVSISAVVVGMYEASLQRAHDRAEVWPRLEIGTYTSPKGAVVELENSGIGPGVVKSITVTADGKAVRNWEDAFQAVTGKHPTIDENHTVGNSAVRPGDKIDLVGLQTSDLPPGVNSYANKIVVRICYSSVFGDSWLLTARLTDADEWQDVKSCPPQAKGLDF